MNDLPQDKSHFLREMLESLSTKFIKGHKSHQTDLDHIPNVAEAIGEVEDLLTYVRGYKRTVERALSLLEACQYLELKELLTAQLVKPQRPTGVDPGFVHVVEQITTED